MDAIEFVIKKKHYCDAHFSNECFCNKCPIRNECKAEKVNRVAAAKIVEEVEKWAKSHSINARASLFFKQFPDAPKAPDGYPEVDPCDVSNEYRKTMCKECYNFKCSKCREKYWGEEIK